MAKRKLTKTMVKRLLCSAENKSMTPIESTAYNHLISYYEGLIYLTVEGDALVQLCFDIIRNRVAK